MFRLFSVALYDQTHTHTHTHTRDGCTLSAAKATILFLIRPQTQQTF